MPQTINPKVEIFDHGPGIVLPDGSTISSDRIVHAASRLTFKPIDFLDELLEAENKDPNAEQVMTESLIKSMGAGHGSLSTNQMLWGIMRGNISRVSAAYLTGATYLSALSPSGRRIPITKENILIPRGIVERGEEAVRVYVSTMEKNIDAYESLQQQGASREEASKIVPYGHRGGGFIAMPLETLVSFSRDIEANPEAVPDEAKEIVAQMVDYAKSHGMKVIYEARRAAPRIGAPNPSPFHFRKNLAEELYERELRNHPELRNSPVLISASSIPSAERDNRLLEWFAKGNEIFTSAESVQQYSAGHLQDLAQVIADFNGSVSATTLKNIPFRVQRELKRHRTLPQTTESIYHAVDRAAEAARPLQGRLSPEQKQRAIENLGYSLSMPGSIRNNPKNLELWTDRFVDSLKTYENLVAMGVPKRDALAVIPRGTKIAVVTNYNLDNLTAGYMSLRLCLTAEEEMRKMTYKERGLFLKSPDIPDPVKRLIEPKCAHHGYCPESPKDYCGYVTGIASWYDAAQHELNRSARREEILAKIKGNK